MEIKFISPVLFVKDISASRRFYEEILGQKVAMDLGLLLDFGRFSLWQHDFACKMLFGQAIAEAPGKPHNAEMYFEADQPEQVCRRLEDAGVEWLHPYHDQPWGQRCARFYDPDGHILELGEPMPATVARLMGQGSTLEDVAQITGMPVEIVRQMAGQAAPE